MVEINFKMCNPQENTGLYQKGTLLEKYEENIIFVNFGG